MADSLPSHPPKLVFLVGCSRSGTTWLQLLLAQHPAIATMEETNLFPEYVSPMLEMYRRNRTRQRKVGVEVCLEEARFRQLTRQFAMGVLREGAADKPQAGVILEKTPGHLYHGADILELFPDAHFVHIIRDPRAVVASLLEAGRTWAAGWAPRDAAVGARAWRDAVSRAKSLQTLTPRYTEISYEALHRGTASELERVLLALGLAADRAFCEKAVEACSRNNLKQGGAGVWTPKSMTGNLNVTLRRGEPDGWRTELSRMQVTSIEVIAADLMRQHGYALEQFTGTRPPIGWYIHRVSHRLQRMSQRVTVGRKAL